MEKTYEEFTGKFASTQANMMVESILDLGPADNAIIVVHDGIFHADDVLATAIVREYLHNNTQVGEIEIIRTRDLNKVMEKEPSALFILDVGKTDYIDLPSRTIAFDHHQDDEHFYANGVKMAACGKIFACLFSKLSPTQHKYILDVLFYPIESRDNGQKMDSLREHKLNWIHEMNMSSIEEPNIEKNDELFGMAVTYAQSIFRRVTTYAMAYEQDMNEFAYAVSELRNNPNKKDILFFRKGIPWMDFYFSPNNTDKAKFIVFPHIQKGYVLRTIPLAVDSFEQTYPLPQSWWGKDDVVLSKVSGIPGAEFCHKSGFMAKWDTAEHAIEAAREAINQLESSGYTPPVMESRPKYVAVDFDGTLTDRNSKYVPDPNFRSFKFNRKGIEVLKRFRANGGKLILWTCRMMEGNTATLPTVIEELKSFGLEFDAVNENLPEAVSQFKGMEWSPKIYADFYIDDRAVIGRKLDWAAIDKYLNEE